MDGHVNVILIGISFIKSWPEGTSKDQIYFLLKGWQVIDLACRLQFFNTHVIDLSTDG